MTQKDVKTKILNVGAELVHRQGFNNTGIQEILKVADIPKGSFYFYFQNKEDFGLQLVEHFDCHFQEITGKVLSEMDISPLRRIRNLFGFFHEYFEAQGFVQGCPIGNLAQEMGDLSQAFGEKLSKSIDNMAKPLATVIKEAQEGGSLKLKTDPYDLAFFIISSWHGALVRMKVSKSREPLDLFETMIFDQLMS